MPKPIDFQVRCNFCNSILRVWKYKNEDGAITLQVHVCRVCVLGMPAEKREKVSTNTEKETTSGSASASAEARET